MTKVTYAFEGNTIVEAELRRLFESYKRVDDILDYDVLPGECWLFGPAGEKLFDLKKKLVARGLRCVRTRLS